MTILNPQEYLRQSRDSQRLKDLTILSKTISWFEADKVKDLWAHHLLFM
ncbi:MAG: hypothetical protein N2Z85_01790 [Patescibacteria group bacterium]|nr:hypothetical protein [Patescibacteria group bacterium]